MRRMPSAPNAMTCVTASRLWRSWCRVETRNPRWSFWTLPKGGWMSRRRFAGVAPPVLDAVFSSYFDQAKNQGILVEANIALPDTLPVDEGALAIVLANALENAIHANLKVPQGQRQIRCKMVATPSVILEISNPCAGDVSFDGDGLPITRQSGHGLGVQSISAFCRKNGAVCHFDLTDDWFRLRLVL